MGHNCLMEKGAWQYLRTGGLHGQLQRYWIMSKSCKNWWIVLSLRKILAACWSLFVLRNFWPLEESFHFWHTAKNYMTQHSAMPSRYNIHQQLFISSIVYSTQFTSNKFCLALPIRWESQVTSICHGWNLFPQRSEQIHFHLWLLQPSSYAFVDRQY